MSNSKQTYNNFIRANLPIGMTFDSNRVRYIVNGKPFVTYTQAEWYLRYIRKFEVITPPVGSWAFSEGSAPFVDSANALALTVGDQSPTVVPDGFAPGVNSLEFDGLNATGVEYLEIANENVGPLNVGATTGRFTYSMWVKRNGFSSGPMFLAGMWDEAGDQRSSASFLGLAAAFGLTNRVCGHVSDTGGETAGYSFARAASGSGTQIEPTDTAWYHAVVTFDGNHIRSYVDGTFEETEGVDDGVAVLKQNPFAFSEPLKADSTAPFTLGACLVGGGYQTNKFGGELALLKVYDRALSDAEIRTLYEVERPEGKPPFLHKLTCEDQEPAGRFGWRSIDGAAATDVTNTPFSGGVYRFHGAKISGDEYIARSQTATGQALAYYSGYERRPLSLDQVQALKFDMNNGNRFDEVRVACRINGAWYASIASYDGGPTSNPGWGSPEAVEHPMSRTAADWSALTITDTLGENLASGTWTDFDGSSTAVDGDTVTVTYNSGPSGPYQVMATEIGKTYQVDVTIDDSTAYIAATELRIGNGDTPDAGILNVEFTEAGTQTATFVAQNVQTYVYLRNSLSHTTTWSGVQVREQIAPWTETALVADIAGDRLEAFGVFVDGDRNGTIRVDNFEVDPLDPPTISGLADLDATYETAVTINAAAAAAGNNVTYSMVGPDWLTIDPATGQITGTTPITYTDTTATVTVTNAAGSASDTFAVTVQSQLSLADVEAIAYDATTRGVPAGTVLTDQSAAVSPGEYYPPVVDGVAVVEDVNLLNRRIVMTGGGWENTTVIFRRCVMGWDGFVEGVLNETNTSPVMDLGSETDLTMEDCTIVMPGFFRNPAGNKFLVQRANGTDINFTAGQVRIEGSEFFGYASDAIKTVGPLIFRGNYVDVPISVAWGTEIYDADRIYASGDVVFSPDYRFVFVSKTDGNIGNPIPTVKVENTFWAVSDPHSDHINPAASSGPSLIEGNYFMRHADFGAAYNEVAQVGLTNGIRAIADVNALGLKQDIITVDSNVITGMVATANLSAPLGLNNLDASLPGVWSPSIIRRNWLTPNNGGNFGWEGEGWSDHVVIGNLTYAGPSQRAASYDGPDFGGTYRQTDAAVASIIGQSENVVAFTANSNYYTNNNLYPTLLPGVDMQIMIPGYYNDGVGSDGIYAVNDANVASRVVSPGAVAIANLWHLGSDGAPLRLVANVWSGTSMDTMLDDDLPDAINTGGGGRDWSVEKPMVDAAETAFGPVQHIVYNWYVNESGASQDLWNERSAHFVGLNPDGSDYDFTQPGIEHCLIDARATKTGGYLGMFQETAKINVMYPGSHAGWISTIPERVNYRTENDGTLISFGKAADNQSPSHQVRRDFLTELPVANRGVATVAPSATNMGDNPGGVQDGETGTHPALKSKYGQVNYSQHVAFALLCAYGHAQPTRLDTKTVEENGAYVDFTFSLPSGATLTTQRLLEGLSAPNPAPPQYQEVGGFVIQRSGDTITTERPLFRMDLATDAGTVADYPLEYRGTAVIHDAAAGIVRITPHPSHPFQNGDKISFGTYGDYPQNVLNGYPDEDAALQLDSLRAYEARLDDETTYRFPGGSVVHQEEFTISTLNGGGNVAPLDPVVETDGLTGTSLVGPSVSGPAIGAGVEAVTFMFEGRVAVQSGFGRRAFMGFQQNAFTVTFDARSGQRQAFVSLRNSSGPLLVDDEPLGLSLPSSGTETCRIMLTATHNDSGDPANLGNWRMAYYLNDALVSSEFTGAAPTDGFFSPAALPTFIGEFQGDPIIGVGRIVMWAGDHEDAFSADGTFPTGTPYVTLEGDAAYWNGTGLPADWTAAGDGAWTDI